MLEDSFLRYLVLFTTACSLIWVQEIQAQNSSDSMSSSSISMSSSGVSMSSSGVSMSSSGVSMSSSGVFMSSSGVSMSSSSSISVFPSSFVTSPPSSQNQSSSIFASKSPVLTMQSAKLTSQVASSPIPVQQTTTRGISSTMYQPSSAITHTTPAISVATSPGQTSEKLLSTTEWILVACLGVFGLILITLTILAVQVSRLNKSVQKLKVSSGF